MNGFNLLTNFYAATPAPSGPVPFSQVGNFNLSTSAGLAPQLNFPDVTFDPALQALASGAPINVTQSNQGLLILGVVAVAGALYFSLKGK